LQWEKLNLMKTKHQSSMTLLLLFCSFLFSGFQARAWEPLLQNRVLMGRIEIAGLRYFLTLTDSTEKVELQSTNFKTETTFKNLQTGDVIRTTVSASEMPQVFLVESVDFVGLNRLLGRWLAHTKDLTGSQTAVVDFHDFRNLSILLPGSRNHFQYAITPKNAVSWRFFFTDESSVQLGELTIKGSKVEIHCFDSQTGQLSQSFHLEKITPTERARTQAGDF
jgi:hypothetical protein